MLQCLLEIEVANLGLDRGEPIPQGSFQNCCIVLQKLGRCRIVPEPGGTLLDVPRDDARRILLVSLARQHRRDDARTDRKHDRRQEPDPALSGLAGPTQIVSDSSTSTMEWPP